MDGAIALVVINFISILVLFGICTYFINIVTSVRMDIEKLKEYNSLNERQLQNMILDINNNDVILQHSLKRIDSQLLSHSKHPLPSLS